MALIGTRGLAWPLTDLSFSCITRTRNTTSSSSSSSSSCTCCSNSYYHPCWSPQYRRFISISELNSSNHVVASPSFSRVSMKRNPKKRTICKSFKLFGSNTDRFSTMINTDEEMGEGFFEAIEELESMVREPADVLEEMNNKLSHRELQLVLVYFSQEGRDSWCALEVFEWLNKENRVDQETMELMTSIMCHWARKLIQQPQSREEQDVGDVIDLLVDMDCVGLKPSFSMIEKVISLYWETGNKENAVLFVKEFLRRGIPYTMDNGDMKNKGGPTGYLARKMMVDGNYTGAVKLVFDFRECGLKPEVNSYLIAMTAVVKELSAFSKALRKLNGYIRAGLLEELDAQNVAYFDNYKSDLLCDGVRLSKWAIEEGSSLHSGVVHERLLAMYICAGEGIKAEEQLWEMRLKGKEPDRELYDIVLAICASQKQSSAVSRLLTGIEVRDSRYSKKTLSWLLRGYVKGGHFQDASKIIMKMLDMDLCPEYLDRAAVLQGLRKSIKEPRDVEPYLKLCRYLSDANLIGPCLVYAYFDKYQLWVIMKI